LVQQSFVAPRQLATKRRGTHDIAMESPGRPA
jgi:hypothetical protein